jgi:hypothetical protein
MLRRRYAPALVILLALSPVVLSFQNCSQGFNSGNEKMLSLSVLAPQISVSAKPDALTSFRDVSVLFSVISNPVAKIAQISCSVDDSAPVDCMDHVDMTNLADGDHTVGISASDTLGNQSEVYTVNFRVDATAPTVMINSGPSAVTGSANASIEFSATDNLAGVDAVECEIDDAGYAPCESPLDFTNLAEGAHVFKVRAHDKATNISSEVTKSWSIDLTAPVISIASGPNNLSNSRTANFTFSGTDNGAAITNFTCGVDGGAFDPCTSPMGYTNFADGNHTFSIKATDAVGNVSMVATRAWTVDATPPVVQMLVGPTTPTTNTSASFSFSATDAGTGLASYKCSLDSAPFSACTNPANYTNLSTGDHNFRVEGVDNLGNISNPSEYDWTITSPPVGP